MNHTTSVNNYQHMLSLASPILLSPNPLTFSPLLDYLKTNPRHSIISLVTTSVAFKDFYDLTSDLYFRRITSSGQKR